MATTTKTKKRTTKKSTAKKDVYSEITNKIIEKMEQGIIPWHKPWNEIGEAKNLVTKKAYRGINVFILACSGFSSQWWMTYKQAQQLKGQVRKGEKGTTVVYWKLMKVEDKDTKEEKTIPFLRHYTVFNLDQIDGIDESKIPENSAANENNPIDECEAIINGMPDNMPEVEYKGNSACYSPSQDVVRMPAKESFHSSESYYSTLFHEFAHSTGHESRLNREGIKDFDGFGSHKYSKEELVAEMTAAYLCGHAGIEMETIDNSAAYIQNWMQKLKNDSRLLVQAAGQAQKAADYMLQTKFDDNE